MARRKSNQKRGSKLEPAITTLTFELAPVPVASAGPGVVPGSLTYYCDLAQCSSLVNRKFFRQGLNMAVAGFKLTSVSTDPLVGLEYEVAPRGRVQIEKLPTNWVLSNSWEKSMRVWSRMNNEALAEAQSIRPRFLDFKIYADAAHHVLGFGANILPISGEGSVALPGEWEPSKMVIPDTTLGATGGVQERELVATGGNYPGAGASGLNAVSLIEGYAASRGLPNILDPNVPDDAGDSDGVSPENWMVATFNEGTQQVDDVIDDLISENNIAPYPFENDGVSVDTMYPGGANQLTGMQIHDFERITGTTVGGTTRLSGGAFACGLLKITIENYNATYELSPKLQINLVPGPHRGLLAESMVEM
jgi:hypothetical protein